MCWLKDKLPSITLVMPRFFKIKNYSSHQQQKNENINFESNRTSSMSEKLQTKQSLLSSKVSSSHQLPNYHTNTASCEYIKKLTLPDFYSFCQPFHIPFFYNIFDQRLFCCYENFFQPKHKQFIEVKKLLALNLPLTLLFSNVQ